MTQVTTLSVAELRSELFDVLSETYPMIDRTSRLTGVPVDLLVADEAAAKVLVNRALEDLAKAAGTDEELEAFLEELRPAVRFSARIQRVLVELLALGVPSDEVVGLFMSSGYTVWESRPALYQDMPYPSPQVIEAKTRVMHLQVADLLEAMEVPGALERFRREMAGQIENPLAV